jgi:hypothetical protein
MGDFVISPEAGYGPKRTRQPPRSAAALGGKADTAQTDTAQTSRYVRPLKRTNAVDRPFRNKPRQLLDWR